jgi:two-component system sensor histidine kinase KdpD
MEQLFINLLENATKYTPHGTEIEVRAMQEGEALIVEVLDGGPGIPEGDEERIFERFYRGPHVGVSGAGLGLPICRAIAQAHGGTLVASNRAAGGAAFRLTLPATGRPPSIPPPAPEEVTP